MGLTDTCYRGALVGSGAPLTSQCSIGDNHRKWLAEAVGGVSRRGIIAIC